MKSLLLLALKRTIPIPCAHFGVVQRTPTVEEVGVEAVFFVALDLE